MYLKKLYPDAKFIIWLHDFFESSIWAKIPPEGLQDIVDNSKLICVSNWHKKNFEINLNLRKIKNHDLRAQNNIKTIFINKIC